MNERLATIYQTGQPAPVKATYEVVGLRLAATNPKPENPIRTFDIGEILPTYEGWEVCWSIRSEEKGADNQAQKPFH